MAEVKNIAMKQYNGTDFDTLYPQTKGENILTPVPMTAGGTNANTGADGLKNLINSAETVENFTSLGYIPFATQDGVGKISMDRMLKCEYGTYTGTGTFGQDNGKMLSFGFNPWFVVVYANRTANSFVNDGPIFMIRGGNGTTYKRDDATLWGGISTTWGNKSVAWYSTQDPQTQSNALDTVYNYFAIGY